MIPRYRFDLEKVRQIAASLGHPERDYRSIHIAGSNGKGSVCWKIAEALNRKGYRVGRYTSPHLHEPMERIAIGSDCISGEELERSLQQVIACEGGDPLSFFERMTLAAFLYFSREKVEIAVIETGLGGRLDATNILNPELTVITSISLEHTALLGLNLESIAAEKAGILKAGVPCVLGPSACQRAIIERAQFLGCPLLPIAPMERSFDQENQAIARKALEAIGGTIDEMALQIRPSCRFERRGNMIFDVAHNPMAFAALVKRLKQEFPLFRGNFVIGLSQDKDARSCFEQILPVADRIYLVDESTARPLLSVGELSLHLDALQFTAYERCPSIKEAMSCARLSPLPTVVCGTFYIMTEALRYEQI